jgi:hypothetical protein
MIKQLRQHEDIILYGNILTIDQLESIEATEFLRHEYENEMLGFPYTPPAFDEEAALWGAKTIYITAQLILYRENRGTELSGLLPEYTAEQTAAAILSADLCLRFLPDMLTQLKIIDTEDALIPILEEILTKWHYSAVPYPLNTELLSFEKINADDCLHQLYCNRIIDYKKIHMAKHPSFKGRIAANLGLHSETLWKDFKLEMNDDGKN